MYTDIHPYVHIGTYIRTYMHANMHENIHTCMQTYRHTDIHTQPGVCVRLLVIYLHHVTAVVLFTAIDSIAPWFDPVKPLEGEDVPKSG